MRQCSKLPGKAYKGFAWLFGRSLSWSLFPFLCWLMLRHSAPAYLHTEIQMFSLILQFITDQLLICINLSSAGGQKSSLRPFLLLLASTKGTGQLNAPDRIFFTQPVLYTKARPCYYSFQSWYCLILLNCLCLFLTLQPLDYVENLKVVALPQTGLFSPWSPTSWSGRLRSSWGSSALSGITLCAVKASADGSGTAQHAGPPGLGKPSAKPVPGSQGCACRSQPPIIITEATALEYSNIYLNDRLSLLKLPWAWIMQEYLLSLFLNELENVKAISRLPCSLISKGQNPWCATARDRTLYSELVLLLRSIIALSLTHWKTISGSVSFPN